MNNIEKELVKKVMDNELTNADAYNLRVKGEKVERKNNP